MDDKLKRVIKYLEEQENCKVICADGEMLIFDKTKLEFHNKDYRLLNDLAKDYVQHNYPLFRKELDIHPEDVVETVFKLPIDIIKFKKVKPFKQIIKKKLITLSNNEVKTISVIRRRNVS